MDVDCYRLAYNVFHRNWQRFGIPEKDIPFPKTEEVDVLNLIIPGFSNAVVLFQIISRSELKTFFDKCPKVHNLIDFCTRFDKMMMQVFPEHFTIVKNLPKDAIEELPKDTVKENLSEDSMMKSLPEVTMQEDQSEDTVETCLSEDNTEEDLSEDSKKESLSEDSKKDDNKIKPEEIPDLIAFSLAVCIELILYQYEDNKKYMKDLPDMWLKYFDEHLKNICDEAGFSSDHLKAYSESIWCSDNLLSKFAMENKNEYHNIMANFKEYIETNHEVESPEHTKFVTEVGCLPEGLSFAKMRVQCKAILESCKCVKGMVLEEVPLLSDFSPSSPTSS